MELITFAHRPEAAAFFEHFKYAPTKFPFLFKAVDHFLILTGEGSHEAIARISFVLGENKEITSVYNFGVAGALGALELDQIVELRHAYCWSGGEVEFKSYPVGLGDVDIVTTSERIHSKTESEKLRPIASIVDREAWAIGFCSKIFQKPLRCFKYLSDYAFDENTCDIVKNKSERASFELLNRYLNIQNKFEEQKKSSIKLDGFHFTHSMQNELDSLLKRMRIKFEISDNEILDQKMIIHLLESENSPKKRAKELIEYLTKQLDPQLFDLKKEISQFLIPFQKKGIHINVDHQYESDILKFHFDAGREDLSEKLNTLQQFSWDDWQHVMQGRSDV